MKCPICDREIQKYSTEYLDGHTLLEEHAECKDGYHSYSYSFEYGNYQEWIGNIAFYSHHTDSEEISKLMNAQYKAVLDLEKEAYVRRILDNGQRQQ
jgi:hypothetical protein